MKFLILLFFLFGCATGSNDTKESPDLNPRWSELQQKAAIVSHLAFRLRNENGFFNFDCDSVGFTALTSVGGGFEVELTLARNATGQWFRTCNVRL